MAINNSKVKHIYDTLKSGGADIGTEDEFNSWFFKPGKEGYENRKYIHGALKDGGDAGGMGNTYEEFASWLGLHAVKPAAKPSASKTESRGLPLGFDAEVERRMRTRTPKQTHPLNKSRARQQLQAQQQAIEAQQQRLEQDNKRFKEDIARRVKRLPGGMERFEERAKEYLATGKVAPMPLAPNDEVVRGDIAFNPSTGRMEQTYTTPEGGTFFDRNTAEFDHSLQNMPDDEIEMLERERELIGMGILRRGRELDDEYKSMSGWERFLAGLATDPEMGPGVRERMYEEDEETQALMTAWRKNRDALRILYDERNNNMNSFWHNFGTTVANGYTFTGGKAELHDAQAIINSSKRMNEIQRKMKAGEKLSNVENAALSLANNTAWDNAIQAMYGDDYGAWATAGGAAVQSLEMMPEFIAGMPVLKGMGTAAIKLLTRNAAKGFGRFMLKGLGMTLGTMAGGAIMANTIQAERTLGKAAGKAAGSWWFGDDGDFMLGHYDGDQFVSGGESLAAALFHAEQEAIPEAASEGAGEFLPGIGQVLSKIGLSRIAKPLASLSGKGWYKTYQNMLRAAGWHGVGGEALEEYVGTLDGLIMGDVEGVKRLADPRTHFDIWLSCATLGPLLNAPVVIGSSMRAAYSPVAYHKLKAAVTRQDKIASFRLTEERWAPWRERIDATPNEQMTDLMMEVRDNKDLAPQEKKAIFDYVKALQGYRGWNLGEYIFGKDAEEEGKGKSEQEQQQSQEYSNGYETVTPEERRAAKDRLDVARARLEQKGYSEQWMQWVDSTPIDDVMSDLTERGLAGDTEAVREYLNAKAAYDGMLQRVNDDIDNDVAVAGEAIEQRVAPEPQGGDGMIHPAVLKDGREVFIVSGNVATLADNSIDVENSDDMIIVRNEVGDIYNITPNDIESLGEVVDPAQQRQQVEQEITETQSQAAAAQIEGALPFNVGDQYTINYQGEPHTYQVVQVEGDNVAVLVDGAQEPVVLTKQQLQQMADEEHAQQIQAQAAAADAVEEEPAAEEGAAQNAAIPEQPTAPVAEEVPAAPEDNPTAAMPMDEQGEPAWDQVEPERGHHFLYQESGWPQAMADNFVQKRIDEAEKALKKAQDAGQELIDNPKPTFAENNAAVAENTAAQQAAQAALDYWKGVQAIQAQATAPVAETEAPVAPAEPEVSEPVEETPAAEAEVPAEPVEEQPAEETPAPVAENEMQPVEEEQPAEPAPAVPDTETAQSAATEDQDGDDNVPQSEATPGQEAGNTEPTREELIEQIKEEFADVLEDGDVEIVPESVHEQGAEVVANITIDGEPTNIWLAVGEGAQVNEHWRSIYVPLENMDWQEISDLADEYNALDGKVCEADSEVKRINFNDVWEAAQFESFLADREEEKQEADVVYYTPADDIRYSIESQGEVPQGEKPKAFKMGEATGNDGNQKGFTLGVYHDPSGTAVATDSYIMIVDSREYDEQHKGKVIAQNNVKKGSEVKEPVKKGEEIPVERYPKWKSVWPKKKETESVKVDFNKLCGWLAGVEKRMKEQWQQWKKEHPGEKMSFDNWRSRSAVQILMPDGNVQRFKFDNLFTFARAAASQGAKSLRYYPNQDNRAFSFDSKFGGGLVMPYNLEAFSYVNNPYRVENGLSVNLDSSLFTYDMSNGATMPGKTAGNRVELNVESGKDAESRAYIEEVMEREGWDEDAKSEFRKMLDDAADLVTRIAKGYTRLREWNEKKLTDEQGNYNPLWRVFSNAFGWIPNRSSFKKNGEYPYNIDLGALCTKREAFDAVVRYIKEQGWGQNLGPTQIEALKSLLRKHGFLTACDICFNETKRARGLDYGNAVAYYWNTVRAAVGIDDDLPIGTPRELTEEQVKMLTELSKPKSHKAFRKYIPQAVRRTYEFYINTKGERKRREADKGLTPTMASKIAKLFLQDPSLMGKFEGTLLLSTDGVDALVRQYPHTTLAEFIAGAWGSATPKPNEGFNVYDPLSWKQSYDKKRQRPAMDWFFNLGGFRAQSFSDYHPIFFYDYVQMFTDLAIRRLPIHIYTKVPALIKLFGGTGAKFNMSLVPEVVQGVDPEHLGLKPDGNGGWELAWHDDSFPVDEAFALREDPRFNGNVGTIAVGISDAHIRMLLDDPRIDMVIPYHKSGMPTSVQVKTGLNNATDYTDDQKTKGMKKGLKDFSFNEALRRLGDPRKAADEYLAWCKQNKCTPKFPQFADHPNYYKVLEDFRCIDNEGNYSEQQPVQMNLFDDVEQRLTESLEDRTMQEGLDNAIRGNDEITEGIKKIMSKPRLDGKIRDMMLARLKQVLGKDNVASLKQEDFFEELQKVYTDQMGAERAQQQVEVLRTSGGIVYGFAVGDRIVLNENYFNAETPMHEFTHVWVKVARLANPQMWAEGKELLKQTKEWQEVMNDEFYRDIQGDEDAVASEVLARIVGQDAARQINEMFAPEDKPQERPGIYNKIKQWVDKFLDGVRSLFSDNAKGLTYDELVRMPMKALFDDAEAARFMEALQQVNEEDATPEYQAKSLGAPYQGSKGQIATRVVDALPSGKRFVDLFSGGGAVTHAAMLSGKYEGYRMNDINPAGQELFLAGMRGDYRDYQPRELTAEEFKAIKGTAEGMMLSYGGLGRNVDSDKESVARRVRRVQRLEELKPYADQVESSNTDYREVQLQPGDVVYADIPYEGTNKTGYREGAKFDKQAFSDWALGQDVPIYVSEQSMPEGWVEVQSWNMKAMRGKTRGEKLFVQAKFAGDQGRGDVRANSAQYNDGAQGDQTRSANFKNWFGDWENDPENASKVVDDQGRPLVVYHGTDADFTIFDISKSGSNTGNTGFYGRGFYFSDKESTASAYGESLIPVYLDIKNPFYADRVEELYADIIPLTDFGYPEGYTLADYQREIAEIAENRIEQYVTVDRGKYYVGVRDKENEHIFNYLLKQIDESEVQDYLSGKKVAEGLKQAAAERILEDRHPGIKQTGQFLLRDFPATTLEKVFKENGFDGIIGDGTNFWDIGAKEYVVFDPTQIKSADEVTFDDEGNEIPEEDRYNPDEQDIRYRELDEDEDAELIDRLENGPHITTYSTKIKSGDGYVPPMSSKDNETGEMRAPEHEQKWNESEERPDLAKQDKKTGKWKFDLKKSNDKDVNGVLYNPYNHSGSGMLNDQFSEAQDRDDLVVVEQVVPQSEETDKYKAEKANDPTGWKAWKAGPITAKMTGKRKVFLSRWHKITRVVPWSEVADAVAKDLGNQFDVLPTNPFPPQLRAELEKKGYKFIKTDNKCVIQEGEYKGATWSERYYDVYPDRAKSKDKREKGARAKAVKEQNASEASRFRSILEDGGTLRVYQREGMGWQNVDEVNLREDDGEWVFNRTIPGRFESRDAALDALLDYSRKEGLQAHADPGSNTYTLRRRLPKGQKWRVEGVPGEFDTQFGAVDNARNFLQGHVFEVAEDGNSIEVLGAGSNLDAITGRGESATQETATETAPQTAKERRAEERARKWRERTVANGRRRVEELGKRLGVKVTIVDDMSEQEREGMSKKKRRAKGWYDVRTGEVFINLGNHRTVSDIEATFLHEVVAHKGLRRLFGDEFDKFLHNVYYNVDASIREEINRLMAKNNWDYREATEEYLAKLAQQMNFERPEKYLKAWETVARMFRQLLQKMGLGNGMNLKDSDLQGILFESYHNMEKEGVAGLAESVEFRDAMEREANRRVDNATYETTQPDVAAVASEPDSDQTKEDREYMDAVERGDMAKASRMVVEAAKRAMPNTKIKDKNGNPVVLYHGTFLAKTRHSEYGYESIDDEPFYVFETNSISQLGAHFGTRRQAENRAYSIGLDASNDHITGEEYLYSVYLDIQNPIELTDRGKFDFEHIGRDLLEDGYITEEEYDRIASDIVPDRAMKELLKSKGYDGAVYFNEYEGFGISVIAFEPNQIKSADPVTYDNDGNLIPLSERFNPENNDIRFRDDEDIDWDSPASKEDMAEHLRNIPSRVGIKPSGTTTAIYDQDDLEALRGVVDDELFNAIEKDFNDSKIYGCYDPESGMVIVFTNKATTRRKAESTWWHEKGHLIFDFLPLEDKEECGREAFEWLHNQGYITDNQYNHYSDSSKSTEGAAWLVKYLFDKYGTDGIINGNFTGNGKITKLAAAIQNYLKNGEETDNNRLRQSAQEQEASRRGDSSNREETEGRLNSQFQDDEDELEDFEDSEDFYEEELEEEADNAEDLGEEVDDSEAGASTFQEMMLGKMLQAANSAGAAQSARVSAMRRLGGALQQIRKAMSAQRNYDRETVNTIVRLAREVMASGYFNDLTRGEVKRLLAAAKNANGSANVTEQANKVVDTLLRHHLRECENLLKKQLKVKGSKENASGVEVQAGLDIEGQRMTTAMKQGMRLDEQGLSDRIADCLSRMGSSDPVVSSVASQEYTGLMLAQQYHETIKASRQEEQQMREEMRQAKEEFAARRDSLSPEELKRERQALKDYLAATEDAIRQNRMERADAYNQLSEMLGGGIASSMERAKQWREQQRERVGEIQHNANSDLENVPADEHMRPTWKHRMANWAVVRFFMKPLATFDYMLRMMGQKSPNGEGYLWNRFMGGWVEANDKEWRNIKAAHQVLDEKVKEVFGRDIPGLPKFKVKRWSDLFFIERKMKGMDVDFWDGDEIKRHTLTPGNLLYIYMVNKMSDGKMKLRKMGISEEDVEAIRDHLDPRLIELADWLQDEFLVQKRTEYNAVHERMFGAPMAAIENYFPLKINSRSRSQEEDVNNQDANPDDNRGSTITGAIIKRVRNNKALDVTGADAFDVILEHIQNMEHWAAFAEFNRDLNTLLSYKRFRNRILNMSSARFGSGQKLWTNFKRVCAIASGVYRPKVDFDSVDTNLVNVAKGVTRAKIAGRFYTALKQFLSYPAYLSEANPLELIKTTSTPIGWVDSWNWAIDNLPGFAERWLSRQAGDTRLKESDADWGLWKNKVIEIASRLGMTPNALVDAWTFSMGAKAIYETKFKFYKKLGYTEEQAKQRALRDASVSPNETQQSSANAYVSAMQLDRTAASVALTVFRNASMGYQRRLFQSFANLKHMATKGYKEQSLEYLTKQMERDGLDHATAEAAAKKVYNRALYKNIADVAIFGWVMQFAWNLGAYLPYLFMGDDDDDKKDMLTDAALHAIAGGIEGLTGGSVMSDTYNSIRSGEANMYSNELLPLLSDMESLKRTFKKDVIEGANDLVNLIIQAGVGVNPQTITDWVVAGLDMAKGDPELANEFGLLVMRVMSAPQGQLDKLYIDELGMTAGEARKLNAEEFANRYARYKMGRESTFTGWAYSEEGRNDAFDRYVKNFDKKLNERLGTQAIATLEDAYDRGDDHMKDLVGKAVKKRLEGMEDGEVEHVMKYTTNDVTKEAASKEVVKRVSKKEDLDGYFDNTSDPALRKAAGQEIAKRLGTQDYAGRSPQKRWTQETRDAYERYQELRTSADIHEDSQIYLKATDSDKAELREIKKQLGQGGDDAAIMQEYREARKEILKNYK